MQPVNDSFLHFYFPNDSLAWLVCLFNVDARRWELVFRSSPDFRIASTAGLDSRTALCLRSRPGLDLMVSRADYTKISF